MLQVRLIKRLKYIGSSLLIKVVRLLVMNIVLLFKVLWNRKVIIRLVSLWLWILFKLIRKLFR